MRINRVRLVDMVPDIMAALMLRAQVFALPYRAVGEGVARAEARLAEHRSQWSPQQNDYPGLRRMKRRMAKRAAREQGAANRDLELKKRGRGYS